MASKLKQRIRNIRKTNSENHRFIPEIELFDIVSESEIKLALRNFEVEAHEIDALTDDILKGAQKCFSILIMIDYGKAITAFFKHDSLQKSSPDNRLPYNSEALQHIFKTDFSKEDANSLIEQFLEIQWEFAVPILYEHLILRELRDDVILPFLSEKCIGKGSAGVARKVEIHPQCHRLPIQGHEVVKKEVEPRLNDDQEAFKKELRNLSLLTHLNHPNIIRLYCAYIHRRKQNFIFAYAEGGSLEDFLKGRSKILPGSQLLLAIADLASAIDTVHNFTSTIIDLNLSGCHHDLAPRNILIRGETFLLADFGLSTFRGAEEDSRTLFKEVRGSYVAPECQTLNDRDLESQKVNRASDIWSFGCILSELLTYIIRGSDGVSKFREQRKIQVTPEFEWFRFHQGPGVPSSKVQLWLAGLRHEQEPFVQKLVDLIEQMLSMDPDQRPRSGRVLTTLRGISVLGLASNIKPLLESLYVTSRRLDRRLDVWRFDSWAFAFSQFLDEVTRGESKQSDFDFDQTTAALKAFIHILNYKERDASLQHFQLSLLRYEHTKLIEALPSQYRSNAKEYLAKQVLNHDSTDELDRLSTAIMEIDDDKDIGILLAIKHLTKLSDTGKLTERSDLLLDEKSMKRKGDVDIHTLVEYEPTSELLIVEWLRYKSLWADDEKGVKLRHRLPSLSCKGFFHDPSEPAFGVVYKVPVPGSQPVTLHTLLSDPYLPLFEYRYKLALGICECIFTFHKVGWLHRNINSMNVLFFPPQDTPKAKWAKEPRIMGFAGSRENQLHAVTVGPDDNSRLHNYQHPDYIAHKHQYREEFDYYSVGMILLEIGFWRSLSKITESSSFQNLSSEDFKDKILQQRVSKLGVYMGTQYMEVTRTCLNFAKEFNKSGDSKENGYMAFKRLIIDRIPRM